MPRRNGFFLAGALVASALVSPAAAQVVTRGPYLQRVSTAQAIVRWRTDVATVSVVRWGPDPDTLTATAPAAPGSATTEHRVVVSGLTAGATVCYALGSEAAPLTTADPQHCFRTARAPGDPEPVRVWAIGDAGNGSDAERAVRDALLDAAGQAYPDALLLLGDNAYFHGYDSEYQTGLFEPLAPLFTGSPLWPALGNHDAVAADAVLGTGPYFDNFSLPRHGEAGGLASSTEAYYAFDEGDVHFVSLDTAGPDGDLVPGSTMLAWLAADLAASTARWKIVYFHHPPYTDGTHHSDNPLEPKLAAVRENVVPLLEAAGVDLVLAGHSHAYERSFLLDGHTGTSDTFVAATMALDAGDGREDGDGAYVTGAGPHHGTVYVVAGSGGAAGGSPLAYPAMAVSLAHLAGLTMTFDGDRVDVAAIGPLTVPYDAPTTIDHFTIRKVRLLGDGFESGSWARWSDHLAP